MASGQDQPPIATTSAQSTAPTSPSRTSHRPALPHPQSAFFAAHASTAAPAFSSFPTRLHVTPEKRIGPSVNGDSVDRAPDSMLRASVAEKDFLQRERIKFWAANPSATREEVIAFADRVGGTYSSHRMWQSRRNRKKALKESGKAPTAAPKPKATPVRKPGGSASSAPKLTNGQLNAMLELWQKTRHPTDHQVDALIARVGMRLSDMNAWWEKRTLEAAGQSASGSSTSAEAMAAPTSADPSITSTRPPPTSHALPFRRPRPVQRSSTALPSPLVVPTLPLQSPTSTHLTPTPRTTLPSPAIGFMQASLKPPTATTLPSEDENSLSDLMSEDDVST